MAAFEACEIADIESIDNNADGFLKCFKTAMATVSTSPYVPNAPPVPV